MEGSNCAVRIQGTLSRDFECGRGLRQGDALSCLLFNMALEKALRDSGTQLKGTIFDKTIQILAYADDVDIIGRSLVRVKEVFLCLDEAAKKLGLVVNEAKTKYMRTGGDGTGGGGTDVAVGSYKFERVGSYQQRSKVEQ